MMATSTSGNGPQAQRTSPRHRHDIAMSITREPDSATGTIAELQWRRQIPIISALVTDLSLPRQGFHEWVHFVQRIGFDKTRS
jgi:hypothetical protein